MSWVDDFYRDVRFAVRKLRKSPGFTTVAVLCLALGIGANAAIFSVVDVVLLRPLPYATPERLVRLYETVPQRDPDAREAVSWLNYQDWTQQVRGTEGLSAYVLRSRILTGAQEPERLRTVEATANLFQVLGVAPRLGRGFAPGEDVPGAAPVVILSEGAWKRLFASSPDALGKTLTLDGQPHTIIGVLPGSIQFPMGAGAPVDLYVPFLPIGKRVEGRGSCFLSVIGRLKPGGTLQSANTELREVARRLEEAYPADQSGRSALAVPLTETVVGRARPALLILQATVLLVLLIACANVANLLLAQSSSRRQEFAIRLALGANRARIIRQLLVESLVLALAGSVLGALLASWGLSAMKGLVQRSLPLAGDIAIQGRVFAFLLLVAAGSAVLFGLVPALQSTRTNLRATLVEGTKASPSRAHHRFRNGLVVAELALCLVLLVGAGLLLRGFLVLLKVEPGFDSRGVLTARLAVPGGKYPPEQISQRLFQPILEHVRSRPGVVSAGLSLLLPIQQGSVSSNYSVEGGPLPEAGKELMAEHRVISPGYYKALGIPLISGRDFTEQDATGEPAVIINQTLAQRHFPQGSAVGQRLLIFEQPATIIGVVGDVRQAGLDQKPLPEIDLPYNQPLALPLLTQGVSLVVKMAGSPTAGASVLREAVRSVDSTQPLDEVLAMEELITRSMAGRRMNLVLLGTFSLIALVLATAGLYGVISYVVSQRTREIGIRMALGARPGEVVKMMMMQGYLLAGMGVAIGLTGALALSRFMDSLLYGINARDALTFGAVSALLGGITLLATWVPARRASRVRPSIAMRSE
ncbi:putative permease [Archangium gephyra]|uniref:Permease n=1 Tax=Archangium gephyra TaxID=48 RepID=A0ABX9JWZ3_9BACT|nr:putative permease [Archangium gephyra]